MIVLIEWSDSHFARFGWTLNDSEEHITDFVTVGIIKREDDKEIEVVPNWGSEFKSQGTTIPKGCIKRIRKLKVETATRR